MDTARIGCLGAGLGPRFRRGSNPYITNSRRAWLPDRPQLWALATLGTTLLVLARLHPLAFRAPTLSAVVETALTLCAVVVAGLFALSFAHRRRIRDLLLMGALVEIAAVDLTSNVLPTTINPSMLGPLTAGRAVGELFMAMALVAAALTNDEAYTGSSRRALLAMTGLGILAAGLAELLGLLLHGALGVGDATPGHNLPSAFGHPLGALLTILSAALLTAASLSFARRSYINIASMLTAAGFLFVIVRLNYLLVPTPRIAWVTANEILRLAAFVVILTAALKQEAATWRMIAHTAAAEERRRIARDLHDGLAQDLAFIAAHSDRIAREAGEDHPLAIAARRALAVSRGAIADLSASDAPNARLALRQVADELELRFGVRVVVEADDAELSLRAREHVVRIAREAIVNSAKGKARNVVVTLAREADRFVLRIRDDGSGICTTTSRPRHAGFGLRSMTERAASLGGGLTAREPAGGGTELEVVFR